MNIIEITDEKIRFATKNKLYELVYEHEWDCSEKVYADYSNIPRRIINKKGKETHIVDLDFYEDIEKLIEEVKDQGFMLCAKDGTKILVNCYNIQNGYYSSDLAVILYEYKKIGSKEINEKINIYEL